MASSQKERIRIGWTGSHSTIKYLREIEPVLKKILTDYSHVEFIVIADRKPDFLTLTSCTFILWNRHSEIKDLMRFDIGIMPLPDDIWSKGKCGFKALQYMALGLPSVVSPVGVNTKIIDDGVDGILCSTPEDWESALQQLIDNPLLRKTMGAKGRRKVIENYSVLSNSPTFLSLFE